MYIFILYPVNENCQDEQLLQKPAAARGRMSRPVNEDLSNFRIVRPTFASY
jgi:hypothetical protein